MTGIEERIGYAFSSRELLEEALRHGSLAGEPGEAGSYQRLEFLGDAVLNLCVAEEAFRRFPGAGEGELTRLRQAVIRNRNLYLAGARIGIPEALRTDRSIRERGGGVTRRMVADAVEALAGAIFLDGGFGAARAFVLTHVWPEAPGAAGPAPTDPKSRLQEWCQARKLPLPRYELVDTRGPDHRPTFRARVVLAGEGEAEGSGGTLKEAEGRAATRLLARVSGKGTAGGDPSPGGVRT